MAFRMHVGWDATGAMLVANTVVRMRADAARILNGGRAKTLDLRHAANQRTDPRGGPGRSSETPPMNEVEVFCVTQCGCGHISFEPSSFRRPFLDGVVHCATSPHHGKPPYCVAAAAAAGWPSGKASHCAASGALRHRARPHHHAPPPLGSHKCRIVGKSQPVLVMSNPILLTRTRTMGGAERVPDPAPPPPLPGAPGILRAERLLPGRRPHSHPTPHHYCDIIEAPWLVNGRHGASLRRLPGGRAHSHPTPHHTHSF